jgi:PAS domain S-box-containing protein
MPPKLPDREPALAPSSPKPQAAQEAIQVAQEAAHLILSTMLDSVAQGTAMFDQKHRLIGWNGRLQRLLDLPDGALSETLTFKDFVGILVERGSTQSARIEAAIRELTSALDQPYVTERMLSDGRVIECRRQALPTGGLMVLVSDVSEQRHAEYLVKDSERQVRTILDKAPVALAVIAQDDGLFKHVNARFRRLFGLDKSISPESIDLTAHLSNADLRKIAGVQIGEASSDFESLVHRSDGSEFWALVSPVRFVFEWAPAILTGFYDISDRRRAELELRDELHRKQAELKEARTLQMELAPPPLRGSIGQRSFAIDIAIEPAKEVGGDLVDYLVVGDTLLVLALGDVSHKGAGAALFMARTHSLIRGIAARPDAEALFRDPTGAAGLINAALCNNNTTGMFVTLLLATFDAESGKLAYMRAGHLPPLLRRTSGEIERLAALGGPPLGLVDTATHKSASVELAPGDQMLIVTDGITEAADASGLQFGESRVREFLATAQPDEPAPLARLLETVRLFEAGQTASDDIAALLFTVIA